MIIYVDDSLCFGHKDDIQEVADLMKEEFKIKSEPKMNDFLGCDIIREKGKDECWLLQPHLIDKLRKNFGEMVKKLKPTTAPGTPNKVQKKTEIDDKTRLGKELHKLYRSGVGSLLCLLKHS